MSHRIFSIMAPSLMLLTGMATLANDMQPRVERYPDVKIGDKFSYVDGVALIRCNHWEVIEANRNGQIVSKCGNNTLYVTADGGNLTSSTDEKGETVAKFTPSYPELSFPLFLGKKWSGKYMTHQKGLDVQGELSCEAASFEPVLVAAGKFDAFRIECINKWDSGIPFIHGTLKSTHWYAPSIHLKVKSVNEDRKWSYEVTDVSWR